MKKETVCIEKGENAYETTKRALDKLNFKVKNKKVLIKPNLVTEATANQGITTDVNVVRAIIEKLENCDITIGEGGLNTDESFEKLGYNKLAQDFNIKLVDLNKDKIIKAEVKNPLHLKKIPYASSVLSYDYIIDVAKLKIHSLAQVTLAMKNMFGCVPTRKNKVMIHPFINKAIVDILQVRYPDFCVIDGIIGNQRDECRSDPVKANIIIAGRDAIAVDIIGTRCMGIDPIEIEHINNAIKVFGKREIEVIGEKIEDVAKKFNRSVKLTTKMRYLCEGALSRCYRILTK